MDKENNTKMGQTSLTGSFIVPGTTINPSAGPHRANNSPPELNPVTSNQSSPPPEDEPASGLKPPARTKLGRLKKPLLLLVVLFAFGGSVFAAYLYGKNNERVIIKEPEAQTVNLPAQAIVAAECVKGRGKQYILPEDIPVGPVYDVVNQEVIAIEYTLNLQDLVTDPDKFSSTILRLTKDYPIDHLQFIPILPEDGSQVESALLVTYVVTKEEANKVTCETETE